MPASVLDPLASAVRLNKMIGLGLKIYRATLRASLADLMQDGFVVGMEPAKNIGEQIALLRLQLPQAQEIMADPNQDPATRMQAIRIVAGYLKLMRTLQGSSGVPAQT